MEISIDKNRLEAARSAAAADALLQALGDAPAYLVGGAVRDALLGRETDDVDIAVEGDLDPILDRLGVEAHTHERFGTATVSMGSREVDLARTRRETYERPGALPVVEPAAIRVDLGRRDFTINAMAVPLKGDVDLLDPYDGCADLAAGALRSITPQSFSDDPTRALRAARYCARLGVEPTPETEAGIREARLDTVSADRVDADLLRLAGEREAVAGFGLLADWGLLEIDADRRSLLAAAAEIAVAEPWRTVVGRPELLMEIATADAGRLAAAKGLAATAADPATADSKLFVEAAGHDDRLLAVARALGASRLDQHVSEWRRVRLEIGGDDLIAAGVPAGPERALALDAALHARIDGRIEGGRDRELEVALQAIGRAR